MKKNKYICALDIGSSKIAACVVEVKKNHISALYFDSVPVKGITRGAVMDSTLLVSAIGRVVKNLKAKSGIAIKSLYTNISGPAIIAKHSHAIIPLAERGNKVITPSDIEKVNDQARILGSSLEEEMLHRFPSSYTIDTKATIANPLGLYSHRLEVDLLLVCVKLAIMQSFTRAVAQAGYEVKGVFNSSIATSEAVFGDRRNEEISVLCDIGSDITELVVFQQNLLKDIKVIPCGGDDFTSKLADTLRIPLDLAEDVKRSYGLVKDASEIPEDKEILLKQEDRYRPIKQKSVVYVANAQAQALAQEIKESLKQVVALNRINSLSVSGRTVLLDGMLEALENSLGVPVKLARVVHPEIAPLVNHNEALSGRKHLHYLVALGLCCLALRKERPLSLRDTPTAGGVVARIFNKVQEVYQEYF